jgi:hypothetical protein
MNSLKPHLVAERGEERADLSAADSISKDSERDSADFASERASPSTETSAGDTNTSRRGATVDSESEDPGADYVDEGAFAPEDEFGAGEVQSHADAFDYVHRKANAFLSYSGVSPQRLKWLDQQSDVMRSEIEKATDSNHRDAREAEQQFQVSMNKYYQLLAQNLEPTVFERLMEELEESGHL